MSDTIMIKSGSLGERTSMPKLSEDELGYQKDEKALYIGTPEKNEKLCDAEQEKRIMEYIDNIYSRLDALENRIDALSASGK